MHSHADLEVSHADKCDHVDTKDDTNDTPVLGIGGKTALLNYYDWGTGMIWADPVKSKTTDATVHSMRYHSPTPYDLAKYRVSV